MKVFVVTNSNGVGVMLAHFTQLARELVELIYPAKCVVCAGPQVSPRTHLLCENCLGEIAARPLPEGHSVAEKPGGMVGAHLDGVLAGWHFDESMQRVIHAFKYRRRPSLSRVLGETLALRLQDQRRAEISPAAPFEAALVPVPLHPRRGRERGFNQSLLLAQAVAEAWNMAVLPRGLERVRFTPSQAKLGAAARRENVEGAFAPAAKSNLQNYTIFLVDDVFTTGATMNACAAALKSAGAARVVGLALAKAA
jgi:ComF family protein